MLKTFYIKKRINWVKQKLIVLFQDFNLANKLHLILMFLIIGVLVSNMGLSTLQYKEMQRKIEYEKIYEELNAASRMIDTIDDMYYFNRDKIGKNPDWTILLSNSFSYFRNDGDYTEYQYMILSLNLKTSEASIILPELTNLQIDESTKTQLKEQFSKETVNKYSSFSYFQEEEKSFYFARCLTINNRDASCTKDKNNEILVNIVYTSASKIPLFTYVSWLSTMRVVFTVFIIAIAIIVNWLLKRTIIKPIVQLSKDTQKASKSELNFDLKKRYKYNKDEIGIIVESFCRLMNSVDVANMLLNEREKRN